MKLERPEELLSRLVEHPEGVAVAATQPDMAAARGELERRGHRIEASSAAESGATESGAPALWRLLCATQHFSPRRFVAARISDLGRTFEVWETCDSTNSLAANGAARGAPHGSLWLSEVQHHGRGRQGRVWSCPAHGGLLFSVLLRPTAAELAASQTLALAVALGACEGLRLVTAVDVRIKWPNDLVVDGAKLGGILAEARLGDSPHVVVGCGINVRVERTDLERAGVPDATSLHERGSDLARELLLSAVLAAVETRYEEWRSSNAGGMLEAWARYDVLRERRVCVRAGTRTYEGVAAGVREDGALRVLLDDGATTHFVAAEVHLT